MAIPLTMAGKAIAAAINEVKYFIFVKRYLLELPAGFLAEFPIESLSPLYTTNNRLVGIEHEVR